MLQSINFREFRLKIPQHGASSFCSKIPISRFPSRARVFLRLNLRDHKRAGNRFMLLCNSKDLVFPNKSSSTRNRIDKYGGVLPSILRTLESDNDLEKNLSLICENLSPKEQTVILNNQRSWERVIRVFEFFKSQENYVPNVIHYNVVLRSLGRAQKWDEVVLLWIEMSKAGVLPSNKTYATLVDVFGKAGQVNAALFWIMHMRLRGLFPDEVTMNTVVTVLKDVGEFDRADRFYKDWCSGKVSLDNLELDSMFDFENGSSSTPVSFEQVWSAELFMTAGRTPISTEVGLRDGESSIKKPELTNTYNNLIDLYGKAGRIDDAVNVILEMMQSGVAMNTFTFNTMIFTCGSHGRFSEAEALLDMMVERGISPDTKTYNTLLSLYASAGNIEATLRYFSKIREEGLSPDTVTFRAVLHFMCNRNLFGKADSVLEMMDEYGIHIDEQTLSALMKMYIDEGLLDRAKTLFDKFHMNRK